MMGRRSRGASIDCNQNDDDVLEDSVSVGHISSCRPARFILDLRRSLAEAKKFLRQSIRMALSLGVGMQPLVLHGHGRARTFCGESRHT
jgi:hypothetical protein